jgi:hypothetical protein
MWWNKVIPLKPQEKEPWTGFQQTLPIGTEFEYLSVRMRVVGYTYDAWNEQPIMKAEYYNSVTGYMSINQYYEKEMPSLIRSVKNQQQG